MIPFETREKTYSQMTPQEEIDTRSSEFAALHRSAVKYAQIYFGEASPQNVLKAQEMLAVDICIVPPHWTGWVKCELCGLRPERKAHQGDVVAACTWCPSRELFATIIDVYWIAHCNELQSRIKPCLSRLREKRETKKHIKENENGKTNGATKYNPSTL